MNDALKVTVDYYDKNADLWAAKKNHSFYHEEGFRKFHALLKDGDRVIDIGCAYGIHVPLFLGIGRNLEYEGFDVSRSMIGKARSRYPQLPFQVADVLDPETLPRKKYRGFWAAAVLMHIPEVHWDEMLANIEKLAVPGAVGYFTLPSERPNEASESDQRHFSFISDESLKTILERRGWILLENGEFPDDPRGIWRWYLVRLP